jgi:hypothetical protein
MNYPKRNKYGEYIFSDFPEFRPNLSPKEIFHLGSFGGTYWRPIKSSITGKKYKNMHKNYPNDWWDGLITKNTNKLTLSWSNYDKSINNYGVKVGQTLEEWEHNKWITCYHPYGWVHWYCDFFLGKRGTDDQRQIERWMGIASNNGRFRKWLITLIIKKKSKWNDFNISPKIRQTLQHWGYQLTKKNFNEEIYNRI